MNLNCHLQRCNLKLRGNYFLVIQIDEVQYPTKNKRSFKQRTEIQADVANPQFMKKIFPFENLSFGSRITFKVGCYNTRYDIEIADMQKILENSVLAGSAVLVFTQRILTTLRDEGAYEEEFTFLDGSKKNDIGKCLIRFKYKPADFDQKIDDDITKIENIYWDPLENDRQTIREKLTIVEEKLRIKQIELEKTMSKLDFIKTSHKSASYEQGELKKQKDNLETENKKIRDKLEKLGSVSELHIHLDILGESDHGADLLRHKLASLVGKLEFERSVYNELSQDYWQMEHKIELKKKMEDELGVLKKAHDEQKFHLNRSADILSSIENLKETIKSQEQLVANLQDIVRTNLKKSDNITSKEVDVELRRLKHERGLLKEKNKQLLGIMEMNEGKIPLHMFNNFKKDEFIMEDRKEIESYRIKADQLLDEVEELTKKLDEMTQKEIAMEKINEISHRNMDSETYKLNRNVLFYEIESQETKAEIIEQEIVKNTRIQANEIANLKQKVALLDGILANTNLKNYRYFK